MNDSVSTDPSRSYLSQTMDVLLHRARGKIIGGLLLATPIVITAWVVFRIGEAITVYAIGPIARLILKAGVDDQLPPIVGNIIAPILAIALVMFFLYGLGYIFQTRLNEAIDWIILKIPGITIVYGVLRNVIRSMRDEKGIRQVERIVLVKFPHPGMRTPAYVMSSTSDELTGAKILVVYIPFSIFPPTGYTLLVPETEVVATNWTMEKTLELLLSGGLTIPPSIPFSNQQ